MADNTFQHWDRAIIHVDMNAFFAGIEQMDDPSLRGRPVAVTNGMTGTCCITCSYEARAFGVKTGMHIKMARKLCPDIVQKASRPQRYVQVSATIMNQLQQFTPQVEIFSVDEAFLDITHCQRLLGHPMDIARAVKQSVYEVSGVKCSLGLSGDKTTAKWAAKQNKPDGFTVIEPWLSKEVLKDVPVTELCGIGRGIGEYLQKRGVVTCGDMAELPISELAKRWGNMGRRIWLMSQGEDPLEVMTEVDDPQSVGHGKILPPDTREKATLEMYLLHMSEKVAARLRRHQYKAKTFAVSMRTRYGWCAGKYQTAPTNDGVTIMALCHRLLNEEWNGLGIFQVQVTALDPLPEVQQQDWLGHTESGRGDSNQVMDKINDKYGEFCLAPAVMLGKSDMPNVINPSWKPFGHRETIQAGTYVKVSREYVKRTSRKTEFPIIQ